MGFFLLFHLTVIGAPSALTPSGVTTQSITEEYFKSVDSSNFITKVIDPKFPANVITTTAMISRPDLVGSPEKKFTFVIPTHTNDLCAFHLCCHKLIENGNGLVGEVVAMWIDFREISSEVDQIKQQFAEANIPFRMLRMWDVTKAQILPGWVAQQVAKLRVAKYISANNYIVLDSKNILVQPLQLSVFQSNQKTYNFESDILDRIEGQHIVWYQQTHQTLRKPWNGHDRVSYSVTPFVFHTKTVLAMISDIERETGKTIDQIILEELGTEFCLYNVYIRREGLLRRIHDSKSDVGLSRILWADPGPIGPIADQERVPAVFFGAHRWWLYNVKDTMTRDVLTLRVKRLLGITARMAWFCDDKCLRSEV
eukprot:c9991_g2_i2.p1 GENE.c9991_g2_i2~~c9991_g2_i2.p1  ORF type:complete len:368 (+),score=78.01 c9991_g2_i2:48-1151(+)